MCLSVCPPETLHRDSFPHPTPCSQDDTWDPETKKGETDQKEEGGRSERVRVGGTEELREFELAQREKEAERGGRG